MVRQYCCCVSNLKATKILAVLAVISSVIGLGYYGFLTTVAKVPAVRAEVRKQGGDPDYTRNVLLGVTIYYAIQLLIEICLLVGAFKEKPALMKIWLGCAIVVLILTAVGAFLGQFSLIFDLALHLWVILAVYGAIEEIKEGA